MRMVQMSGHQVVEVIGMRDAFVPAARAVRMRAVVLAARVTAGAGCGVRLSRRQRTLVNVVIVHAVQVAIMEVVRVVIVPHRRVAATGAVPMIVRFMGFMLRHYVPRKPPNT